MIALPGGTKIKLKQIDLPLFIETVQGRNLSGIKLIEADFAKFSRWSRLQELNIPFLDSATKKTILINSVALCTVLFWNHSGRILIRLYSNYMSLCPIK